MTITAPPRPAGPSDPIDREDPEALIEEARRRARNRRRIYGALAGLAALVGVAVFTVIERAESSQSASSALGTQVNLSAGTANSKIVFLRDPDGDGLFGGDIELLVMNPDGSGQRRLTRQAKGAAWSPDASKVAFYSQRGPLRGGDDDVYVVNADGSGERRLTSGAGDEWFPVWSPDGRQIAFTSGRGGSSDIYVMNADGSGQRRLTRDPVQKLFPVWSPDGREIAFQGRSGETLEVRMWDIYVIDADGSGQRKLTQNLGDSFAPAWSPDGRKIAFSGTSAPAELPDHEPTSGVYVMNAGGSGQRTLAPGRSPVWSLDGSKIAFLDGGVHVMNADGTGQRRLGDSVSDVAPSWSPDGRQVLFARYSGEPIPAAVLEHGGDAPGNFEIFVANVDGSASRNLTLNPGDDISAAWSAEQQK